MADVGAAREPATDRRPSLLVVGAAAAPAGFARVVKGLLAPLELAWDAA